MLLRIAVNNFLSFFEEVTFDMYPNPKRKLFQSHIHNARVPLLKQAAIYGENGAGKSNFVKALWFLKSFVEQSSFISHKDNLEEYRFQLAEETNLPIIIKVEFCQNDDYYIYEIELRDYPIERFWKSGIGEKDNELLFERNGSSLSSALVSYSDSARQLLQKNRWASLLSLNKAFPVLNNCKALTDITEWFANLEVVAINSEIPVLIDLMSRNSSILEFANQILQNVGIANSLQVKETPLEEWLMHEKNATEIRQIIANSRIDEHSSLAVSQNNRVTCNFTVNKGVKIVQEFIFEQLGVRGFRRGMNIASQSDGTVRLLTLIPAFYKAMKSKSLVVIDEIEHSIHPNLIYKMVKYYAENVAKGQIIFTTHLTRFQNQQELMRPDELWKTEKVNGCTTMRSFNDYNIHQTMNIEKGYNEGRYGGVPVISQNFD